MFSAGSKSTACRCLNWMLILVLACLWLILSALPVSGNQSLDPFCC